MRGVARHVALICGILAVAASEGRAQSAEPDRYWNDINKLHWQFGATQGRIGEQATLVVPKGYGFLGSADTRRFLELNGNPARDNRYLVAPEDLKWFGVFVFEPLGYVRDDETIDPDRLLQTLRENATSEDEERKRLGMPALHLEGWSVPPHYDAHTKRLEWGTKLRTEENELLVNYTIKLLGRSGVMDAILVSDPQNLDRDVKEFKSVLTWYDFTPGHKYSEFRSGDKVAEYGLTALVVGGAAAAAAKSGAFKGLAKLIAVGIAGVCAACWGFLKRLFRRA